MPAAITINQWFTTSSFAAAVGHFGNAGSNSLLGPGLDNWDLAAIKNLSFADRCKFQLRGEFFNAFNHTNLNGVDLNMADGDSFGAVTSDHVPRRIQLGAKFYFQGRQRQESNTNQGRGKIPGLVVFAPTVSNGDQFRMGPIYIVIRYIQ